MHTDILHLASLVLAVSRHQSQTGLTDFQYADWSRAMTPKDSVDQLIYPKEDMISFDQANLIEQVAWFTTSNIFFYYLLGP